MCNKTLNIIMNKTIQSTATGKGIYERLEKGQYITINYETGIQWVEKGIATLNLTPPTEVSPEEEYFNYLKDKRVIIVGPANYLSNINLGEWIDSFDVVVRLNARYDIKFKDDYGSKVNVMYLNGSAKRAYLLKDYNQVLGDRQRDRPDIWSLPVTIQEKYAEKEINLWKENGLQWFSVYPTKNKNIESKPIFTSVKWVKYTPISWNFKFGTQPYLGIYAVDHILQADIKSLNIVGFDFYNSDYYNRTSRGNPKRHDKNLILKYFKKVVENNHNLYIDEVLTNILKGVENYE